MLPLPRLLVPILKETQSLPAVSQRVFELAPGFRSLKPVYLGDPGPSWIVVAVLALALSGLIVFAVKWLLTLRLVRASEQVVDDSLVSLLYELGQHHKLSDVPVLKRSDQIDSPCVWGITQPVILVPSDFESSYLEADWRSILDHEMGHLAQRDPLRLVAFSIVAYALWWNPLVWLGLRDAILAQEQSNDGRHQEDRAAYSRLLVSKITVSSSSPRLRFFGKGHLLTRVRALSEPPAKHQSFWSYGALCAFIPLIYPIRLVSAYHPDPKQIGYNEVVCYSTKSGENRLWRMASDGRDPAPLPDLFIGVGVPTVSPDGKWIAYNRDQKGKEDIYIARVDGTDERLIVSTPERDVQPTWCPTGTKLAFCTMASGNWEVGVANLVQGGWRFLTKDGKRNLEPSWHPNGSRLVFASHRTGSQKLWSVNLDGSDLVQLTFGTWEDTAGRYSRDGRYVAFSASMRAQYEAWLLDLLTGERRPLTPIKRLDGGEVRFVDADRALLMSTTDRGHYNIARVELGTGEISLIGIGPYSHWPATR